MSNETTLKFNWGWGIIIFFTCFVSFIFFMIYKTTTVGHELVTTDYYQQEIEFQKRIDHRNNLIATGQHIEVTNYEEKVGVHLPAINNQVPTNAKIYFYRASDQSKDIKMNNEQGGVFMIDKNKFIKGEYVLHAEWECNGKTYYEETNYTVK